jgi:hypothetical protein
MLNILFLSHYFSRKATREEIEEKAANYKRPAKL